MPGVAERVPDQWRGDALVPEEREGSAQTPHEVDRPLHRQQDAQALVLGPQQREGALVCRDGVVALGERAVVETEERVVGESGQGGLELGERAATLEAKGEREAQVKKDLLDRIRKFFEV